MKNVSISDTILACFLTGLFAFCITLCGAGCQSARLSEDAGGVIAGNARTAGKLEATVSSLDRILEGSRDRIGVITRASERIADGIDRAEFLFSEYEQEVGRLLDEVDQLRNQIEGEGESNSNVRSNPVSTGNN